MNLYIKNMDKFECINLCATHNSCPINYIQFDYRPIQLILQCFNFYFHVVHTYIPSFFSTYSYYIYIFGLSLFKSL